jgi:hypothetical protein
MPGTAILLAGLPNGEARRDRDRDERVPAGCAGFIPD